MRIRGEHTTKVAEIVGYYLVGPRLNRRKYNQRIVGRPAYNVVLRQVLDDCHIILISQKDYLKDVNNIEMDELPNSSRR